jgi:ABC-2 type transport system ATP-binding protein
MQALANSGCAVLVSTHYIEEALYCNRIGLIHQSRLIYQGTPKELQKITNTSDLEDAFIQFIQRQGSP